MYFGLCKGLEEVLQMLVIWRVTSVLFFGLSYFIFSLKAFSNCTTYVRNKSFSRDVTAGDYSPNNETAAMLVILVNPVGTSKCTCSLATRV